MSQTEGAKQSGKSFRGTDASPLTLLRRSCPEFLSAIASVKEHQVKKISNKNRGGNSEFGQELDAAVPPQCIRSGTTRTNADAPFNVRDDSASAAPKTSEGLTERMQERNASTVAPKKRRRDGMISLSTTAATPSPSTAVSASNRIDDNNVGAAAFVASGSRNRRTLPESPRSFLREALVNCSRREEDAIPDELVANFDGMAFFQLLQQCSGGVCVSLERAEEGVDGQNGSDYTTSPSLMTKSSSSLNGSGNLPIGRLSKRELQAQLSAALAWASSAVHGVEDENDDDGDDNDDDDGDDGGVMVRLPRAILETASQIEHPSLIFELLHCKDSKGKSKGAGAGCCGKNTYTDDTEEEDDDEREEEDEEDRSFLGDLDDLKETTEKVNSLSLHTINELAAWWGIPVEGGNGEVYRLTITEHFRLLAFTICAVVSNTLESQPLFSSYAGGSRRQDSNEASIHSSGNKKVAADAANGASDSGVKEITPRREDDQEGTMRGLLSLRHDICTLSAEHLRYFANIFGFPDRCCSPEDIFTAISAVAVVTFFSPLPTPLLEKVCHELSISTVEESTESTDVHQLPELLAEKISHYFYSPRYSVPSISKLSFMPQMQIHEHAPGRYTCTVDNAKLMKVIMLQRLISNRFSCNKIRWHALLTVINDKLSFYVWHRNTGPITAHMIVRTQDPKKKRKNNGINGGDNNNRSKNSDVSPNPESSLRESSALFLEREVEAAPGELMGFENFVSLTVALHSSTMSQSGYRLYNRVEDRLVFQYAMDLICPNGAPPVEEKGKKSSSNHQNGKSTCANRGLENSMEQGRVNQQATTDSASTATANAENEKRRKEWEKVVIKLEKSESQKREAVDQAWNSGYRQLLNEHGKSYQKALQKKKDRERKLLLAKVGPSPELLRELETLTQTVSATRAQVAKLAKEKSKEEASTKKLQEQIEEGKLEVEQLRQQLKSSNELLSSLETEAAARITRFKERGEAKRRKQRDLAAALRIPEMSSTRHETLAINDLQSFWAPSSTNGANSQLLLLSTLSATSSSPARSPQSSAIGAPGVNPNLAFSFVGSGSGGGGGGGGGVGSGRCGSSVQLQRVTEENSCGVFSPPLQSTAEEVMGVGMSAWASMADPLSFSEGGQGGDTANTFGTPSAAALFSPQPPPLQQQQQPDAATHLAGVDAAGGSAAGQSSGFTVTAPYTSGGAAPRFTLDANACPFTPTTLVTGRTSCNSVPHTSFAVKAGAAPVSLHSPLSTSPTTVISGNSPVVSGGIFPERPRYTSVSAPVLGGVASNEAFSTDPLQSSVPLFAPPGLSSASGKFLQPTSKALSLNFTTAPWN
ncbi:hypothetical protein MOQ_000496 [Trypanosoma cruzi marinkellei]|uniref:Uncharacterized protein n=1 Tax=Trypanosoma cruzi marinkellei TaxID=85056 RepID=K2PE99_TRYCR|nr:hypothetical protein MOQ_000496 [Trypanosoma cruzi marinkellei]